MSVLIELQNLKKYFETRGEMLHAVDDINMKIDKGTTMGVVGESGCGKSTLGRTIIHLHESTSGKILYEGRDVTHVKGGELKKLRQDMQIIFQDPFSSLNPRFTIEETLKEPLLSSGVATRKTIDQEVSRIMDLVGIASRLRLAYPHELDGGRRQRVSIGRALAMNPKFIVCDEPVSALDVSIQAQVLNLLMDLQDEYELTYMFVTHDLSVVRHISRDISVMYLGQLVETCEAEELFNRPLHPYTVSLLSAIPSVDIHNKKEQKLIKGELTSPVDPKPGCRFAKRCPFASKECSEPQELREVEPNHFVKCHKAESLASERK